MHAAKVCVATPSPTSKSHRFEFYPDTFKKLVRLNKR